LRSETKRKEKRSEKARSPTGCAEKRGRSFPTGRNGPRLARCEKKKKEGRGASPSLLVGRRRERKTLTLPQVGKRDHLILLEKKKRNCKSSFLAQGGGLRPEERGGLRNLTPEKKKRLIRREKDISRTTRKREGGNLPNAWEERAKASSIAARARKRERGKLRLLWYRQGKKQGGQSAFPWRCAGRKREKEEEKKRKVPFPFSLGWKRRGMAWKREGEDNYSFVSKGYDPRGRKRLLPSCRRKYFVRTEKKTQGTILHQSVGPGASPKGENSDIFSRKRGEREGQAISLPSS